MIATRTFSSERRALPLLPLVEAMGSFPASRSVSVSTIRSLTFRLRFAARSASLSFNSAGMRRSTEPLLPGCLPGRPLSSNWTAKREARIPTATSLRLRPVLLTSSARSCFSSAGIRTRTCLRAGASTEVLALYPELDEGAPESALAVRLVERDVVRSQGQRLQAVHDHRREREHGLKVRQVELGKRLGERRIQQVEPSVTLVDRTTGDAVRPVLQVGARRGHAWRGRAADP